MKRALPLLVIAACGGSGGAGPDAGAPLVYGGDRPTTLQTPATIEPGKTYPLIVVLHGYGATGLLQTAVFRLGDVATDPGAFLLAPDGTVDSQGKQFWNARAACCNFDNSPVDDVGYLSGLITSVEHDWPVDPKRVFLIGHSNGGFMAHRMACDRADLIDAIADLAGAAPTVDGSDCAAAQPVSVLHLHGSADTDIDYHGTPYYPSAIETVTQWAQRDGCATTQTTGAPLDLDTQQPGAETVTSSFDGCPAGGQVDFWSITGAGHVPRFVDSIGHTLTTWLQAHPRP